MTKKDRQKVFDRYGGRCAYCGCQLTKGWHVDEMLPIRRNHTWDITNSKWVQAGCLHPERLNLANQMPACASCNISKHSDSLESFRRLVAGFIDSLNNYSTQYKIAKRYGLVVEQPKEIVFYFETIDGKWPEYLTDPYHPENIKPK